MYMFSDLMFMYMIASCAISLKREKYCEPYKTQEYILCAVYAIIPTCGVKHSNILKGKLLMYFLHISEYKSHIHVT